MPAGLRGELESADETPVPGNHEKNPRLTTTMSDPYYSLYCKQRKLERIWQPSWACGFASLVTCFRLLGDRTTENGELVRRFRKFAGPPQAGMTTAEAIRLAEKFGYRAAVNPPSTKRDWDAFDSWMDRSLAKRKPVMLSVDTSASQDEANHWWVVYGDPEGTNLWVMDPNEADTPFELLSRSEIEEFASCNDGEGWLEFDGVAISSQAGTGMISVPPSAALMEFLNEDFEHATGWTSQEIAAALVDNHFSSVDGLRFQGQAKGSGIVSVSDLLKPGGSVEDVIEEWDVFFSDEQRDNIEALSTVLYDVEAHMAHQVIQSQKDHMTREIALNLILIGTNLMDG